MFYTLVKGQCQYGRGNRTKEPSFYSWFGNILWRSPTIRGPPSVEYLHAHNAVTLTTLTSQLPLSHYTKIISVDE